MHRIVCLILLAVALAAPDLASAQTSVSSQAQVDKYIEMLRTDLRTGKVELYDQSLGLSPEDSAAFWPLYREYDYKQSLIGNNAVDLLKEYSQKYSTLTDDDAYDMMQRTFDNREDLIDLRREYYKKMSRAIGAKDAGRFFQLERVITDILDLKVSSELPLMK